MSALAQLRVAHPALPQLRDFQVSPGPLQAVCIQHNVFSWIYCRVLWIKMIQTISSALCLRALGRPCPCCCWATFCLQVLEFQSWKPHAIQKRFRLGDDDPGSSHHDRASASRGLQETAPEARCMTDWGKNVFDVFRI